ncbi:MAG: hypothetical protein AMK71_05165 [Nitrospira bacterium SG8_35_4]|nr:MAG: hypothetical protein AMK71_05165 [Nitrospira bacterium SG8_35_4]
MEVNQGVYSVELGSSTAFPTSLDFNSQYYREVAIDVDNSTTFDPGQELSPRQKFTSVPSALNSDRLDGIVTRFPQLLISVSIPCKTYSHKKIGNLLIFL